MDSYFVLFSVNSPSPTPLHKPGKHISNTPPLHAPSVGLRSEKLCQIAERNVGVLVFRPRAVTTGA